MRAHESRRGIGPEGAGHTPSERGEPRGKRECASKLQHGASSTMGGGGGGAGRPLPARGGPMSGVNCT